MQPRPHFINEVIVNFRRFSRDLSPAILEDLGLSAALKYLLEEFVKYHDVQFFCPVLVLL